MWSLWTNKLYILWSARTPRFIENRTLHPVTPKASGAGALSRQTLADNGKSWLLKREQAAEGPLKGKSGKRGERFEMA